MTNHSASPLKVVILSQEDFFAIPLNVEKILCIPGVEVPIIAILNTKGSLVNKKQFFLKGFGLRQCVKMGLYVLAAKLINFVDWVYKWKIRGRKYSIRAVAGRYNCNYIVISDPNGEDFLATLERLCPDVVLSFSAPVIFCPKLLSIPRLGCINLHCSYLPFYAGLLPSFWVLYQNESETGATVHYMDSHIDNGVILDQEKVPIAPDMTMFELIQRTKDFGGNLVCRVLASIQKGQSIQLQANRAEEGTYYTWPTVEQMKEFRRRGGRLI